MSTIQDIRALEQRITDIVEDYINELYNEDDVLYISNNKGQITLLADTKERFKSKNYYPLGTLVRYEDTGRLEADIDKISAIANSWLFLS